MIRVEKINDFVVKPIQHELNQLPIKGSELFSEPYCNAFLCAKKKSGKSTIVYNIIKKCIGKETIVHIFASTAYSDQTYKKIMEYLEKRKIEYEVYTSIIEEGQNIVRQIIDELNEEAVNAEEENSSEDEPEVNNIRIDFGEITIKKTIKRKKPKYLSPQHLFIFDDLGATLRDKAIDSLLKVNRHYKSKVIISSQYLNDLSPQARLQLDYVLLFKGLPIQKLAEVYKDVDLSIDFEQFLKYYGIATKKQYNFLYIDVRNEAYRINFNTQFIVRTDE